MVAMVAVFLTGLGRPDGRLQWGNTGERGGGSWKLGAEAARLCLENPDAPKD